MTNQSDKAQWYTVRCIFRSDSDGGGFLYEERVTLWHAKDFDEAIALAEAEAAEYAENIEVEYLGLAQAYFLPDSDPPTSSTEVFSLVRESELAPTDYLNRFFETGRERQRHWHDQ